ncbi:MAG: 2-phospho-L-lactate transferase [Candidatus Methanoperedens sp.]|nr:2-phospho-L-lactate transferase [Candidatus Methanoperedens sp.]
MILLSGGTGTPKLLQGLRKLIPDEEITVIVNTAEDIMISGNLVSPDVDTVLYLFSGQLDDAKWWGVRNDTFHTHNALKKMGINEKLMIGDTDRAAHIFRSEIMRTGARLTEATMQLSTALRIRAVVLPMCDEKVDTMISTPQGDMHFQDFWVGAHGEPDVLDIKIKGIEKAKLTEEVMKALGSDDRVIIGPSNPITSIGPIISIEHMRGILSFKKVIAISPIIGNAPVSGPAGKLMRAKGYPVSSAGVAQYYGDILDVMVIDERDTSDERDFPVKAVRFDTMMTSVEKSEALAGYVLELFETLC